MRFKPNVRLFLRIANVFLEKKLETANDFLEDTLQIANIFLQESDNQKYFYITQFMQKPICVIFDNDNNLYITTDGVYKDLLTNTIYDLSNNSGIYLTGILPKREVSLWGNTNSLILPVAMRFNKDYTQMYVVEFGKNEIAIVDVKDGSIIKSLNNNDGLIYNSKNINFLNGPLQLPNGGAIDANFEYLYITNTKPPYNNVISINLKSYEVVHICDIITPILICNYPKDNSFYVTSVKQNTIYRIDNMQKKTPYIVDGYIVGPRGITFSIDLTKLYITNYNPNQKNKLPQDYISVYDVTNIKTPIFLYNITGSYLNQPRGLCFNERDPNTLIISNFGDRTIYGYKLTV
jgi:sugar lactone lactonase YvrE